MLLPLLITETGFLVVPDSHPDTLVCLLAKWDYVVDHANSLLTTHSDFSS